MCSVITVSFEPGQIRKFFPDVLDPSGCDARGVDIRVHGYLKKENAPVVFLNSEKKITLDFKYFSLCPAWSKQWPFAFETYNARLSRPKKIKDPATGLWKKQLNAQGKQIEESIYQVPSFRDAFNLGQTCLVPVSSIIESCYFGLSAGHIVRFCVENAPLLFLLGLWNDWVHPTTGEVIPTFTLLTDAPDSYVFRHGHDRGVLAVESRFWMQWLNGSGMSGIQRFQFARSRRVQPAWRVELERKLKSGWFKRAPTAQDIEELQVWDSEEPAANVASSAD